MDIHSEVPAANTVAPAVDAAAIPEMPTTPPGEVLGGLGAPLGDPAPTDIKATHNAMVAEKTAKSVVKPGFLNRVIGSMFPSGKSSTETTLPVNPVPDHLAGGVTPTMDNLNGATAEGPSAPKFGDPVIPADETPMMPSTEPTMPEVVTPVVGAEVVASAAPTLGDPTPTVDTSVIDAASPMSTAGETADEPAVVEPPAATVVETPTTVTPPEYVPADMAPAEAASSDLPDLSASQSTGSEPVADVAPTAVTPSPDWSATAAPASEPAATPPATEAPTAWSAAAMPKTEEPVVDQPVGLSATASGEAVQAGPGAGTGTDAAPSDWTVNPTMHADAPVVPSASAMADGAAAAADKPPFSVDALNQPATAATDSVIKPVGSIDTAGVGHDIPMEVIAAEPLAPVETLAPVVSEIADVPAAAITPDTNVEPTAPPVVVPGASSPTNPAMPSDIGMVDTASSLAAGMPQAEIVSAPKLEIIPPSSEVDNVVAFPAQAPADDTAAAA